MSGFSRLSERVSMHFQSILPFTPPPPSPSFCVSAEGCYLCEWHSSCCPPQGIWGIALFEIYESLQMMNAWQDVYSAQTLKWVCVWPLKKKHCAEKVYWNVSLVNVSRLLCVVKCWIRLTKYLIWHGQWTHQETGIWATFIMNERLEGKVYEEWMQWSRW